MRVLGWIEVIYMLEILVLFFTSYRDRETFKEITELKKIASNFVLRGRFFIYFFACLPLALILKTSGTETTGTDMERDLLMVKMLRYHRYFDSIEMTSKIIQLLIDQATDLLPRSK